ncbi:AraC-like DNA-binding protein [Clostridium acetobutylicum]|uniref:AraC-type sugar metabolism regulator n=1 Tax=Clostridium acetobutylicum (strain ATCC 824 / DSM 792 / JCM 1419 / IAM 19013 / LMG 5710 / NBRC 13948 / NRRL B-527 / VKM B-1787 / 2291 / W) TaxID=272562 RepID=Q97JF3_CLOAB|nr:MULTISPECIES: AraC family transcriptional regulator [Clostridium]AAK79301.1 AraC-type sugar metabolism regulator [Clostridium acetobutylicum ATCC 824]ADZ20384.1 AraC-type sugar metabolism regulator [Clostridium acetobutylicum EA 2018]AEI34095.1 AraC-type sugar metabolism regulator [Clostridium acetobutylicum DSM 1731]AWV81448.1 AraC family transcriptional regulator [Clostridium acetobutylicum]MBC2393085.1 AraC family transcriptional regulator [Clostridium acetobutylicum]
MRRKIHKYMERQYMLSADYEIYHYSNNDIRSVSIHHHDFYEFYFFISGDVTYLIEGKSYCLNSGNIILINSRELHQAIINSQRENYERIVLWISRVFLQKLSSNEIDLSLCFESNKKKNVLIADFEQEKNIRAILNKIISLENYKAMGYELLYKAYITELMVNIYNLEFSGDTQLSVDTKKSNLIDEIIEYITFNIEEDITIDKIAEQFYLSKFHLSREFKKYTGTTIHRYIIQKKLIQAKELILKDISITDVYKKCGFGDYSNFFRAFKNEYKITPKQFYEAMKK